jgi:hypothetical protein
MDLQHWVLLGVMIIALAIPIVGFWQISRILRKDEAIDAATFLALKDLRERFERTK